MIIIVIISSSSSSSSNSSSSGSSSSSSSSIVSISISICIISNNMIIAVRSSISSLSITRRRVENASTCNDIEFGYGARAPVF